MTNRQFKALCALSFVTFSYVGVSNAEASDITLGTPTENITLSPQYLNVQWNGLPINTAALKVNHQTQTITNLKTNGSVSASWTLQPSGIQAKARLNNNELTLSFAVSKHSKIHRNQPITLDWFNLDEQKTTSLLLPFGEGMRIPINHPQWAKYLDDSHSGANTTQDLKMPFWTAEINDNFFSYQLITATNNQLNFAPTKHKVDMQAAHQFTVLNRNQPFTVVISRSKSVLGGAQHYRQWRIANKLSESFDVKMKRNPQLQRLIGASHVYLFGKDPLSIQDVRDWWGLKDWFFNDSSLAVSKEANRELGNLTQGKDWFSQYHKQLLLDSISISLANKFSVARPTLSDNTIKAQFDTAQQRTQWLAKHAGKFLITPNKWGQALSTDMLASFKKAGLNKLWLGFDNWMPAFYNPEVIDAAKNANYLVATYDSYNTAIPAGTNDGWLTAQLPTPMRQQCAIEQADGTKKKGFRGNGYYLNPNCHLAYVQQRILDIVKYGRFNSLFLDVDATAMAREDYRDGSSESDMLTAFNDRMAWIASQDQLVLGSEDGNSLTTKGISFAHGLETVGFGWTDKDMHKNRKSPYYLGRWYPDHKPEFFFKPAKVKTPYKTLLFSPQYRVPLYQTVFHDEVINNHHWHTDILKFTDVKAARDLTAMLYNTPPMVHLTRDEALSSNSPRIRALKHYQIAFEPIHQQLWDKALVNFSWLDKQGVIQQTTFSDGSKIIANFSNKAFVQGNTKVKALSIRAKLSNGKVIEWQSKSF
ncbi:glycosyl hydrolase [Photobacterium jeanii]|uniref:Glycosyl hydrolase n=1 Tax=Photobacterium jeanii TaxID=858640 RepID=A0A178KMR7_9GAMM|nr:glycoside hydrolase [Photobacterium jeanii]OAN18054.1 glycosyl hydrolase [Photobacterium jeanii]PST92274.1 glycosyl hydrolase [Photobacterium jeanii]